MDSVVFLRGFQRFHRIIVLLYFFHSLLFMVDANTIAFTFRYTADPAPLVINNTVYIYTSHDLLNVSNYVMYDYSLISSTDMVNFVDHGIVFDANNASWGSKGAWAQQVLGPHNGGSDGHGGTCTGQTNEGCYYMYWPNMKIHSTFADEGVGIAVSSTGPTGPFIDITPGGVPFMPGDDPTIFQDDDGSLYLCSNPVTGPLCGELNNDMVSWKQVPRNLTDFEHWFEAPWLMKINSTYYLSYMCPSRGEVSPIIGHYGQDICVAVCDPSNSTVACPLGNYTFLDLPLQWNPPYDCAIPYGCSVNGGNNAHHGIFSLNNHSNWYVAYHTRELGANRGLTNLDYQRNIGLDRAYWNTWNVTIMMMKDNDSSAIKTTDPKKTTSLSSSTSYFLPVTVTPNWLRQLHYVDPYSQPLPGSLTSGGSDGIDTTWSTDDPLLPSCERMVMYNSSLGVSWTRITGVDFGNSSSDNGFASNNQVLTLRVGFEAWLPPAPNTFATLSLVLDDILNTPVASCNIPVSYPFASSSWLTYNCSFHISYQVIDIHDVFLVADLTMVPNDSPSTLYLSWWMITGGGSTSGRIPPPVQVSCSSIRTKGSGKLFTSTNNPNDPITVLSDIVNPPYTSFVLQDNEDGTYSIQINSLPATHYICVDTVAPYILYSNSTSNNDLCTRFILQGTTDGSYAFGALMKINNEQYTVNYVEVDETTGSLTATAKDPRTALNDTARFWLTCGNPLRY